MYLVTNSASAPYRRAGNALEKLAYAGLCAFVVALPWGGDTTTIGGLVLANWIALVPVIFTTLSLLVNKTVRPFCPIHFLLLAFTAWAALSLFWTVDFASTVTRLGTYGLLLVFVVLIWELATTAERVQGLIISYVLGAAFASIATIYNYARGQTTSQQMGLEWETYRYSVDGVNADELGLIVALSIPMVLYLLTVRRNRWLNALCWAQVIAGITAILISATRGALFAVAVGMVMMAGPTLTHISQRRRGIAVIACIALVSCAVFVVPKTSLDRILSTGTELTEGTLTHRTVIWAAGMEVFRDHPFLGVGAGAYGPATVKIVNIPLIAHNTFVSVLVELGVFGLLLLLMLLASLFYGALRMKYLERRFWFALLMTWVIGVCSLTQEYRKITWLLFGLAAAHVYAKNHHVVRLRREGTARSLPGWENISSPSPAGATSHAFGRTSL